MQIVCKNLSFTYNQNTKFKKKALDGINLEIKEGEFLGIIGHTGSGKSTFIQHLNALIPLQEGELYVGEYNLGEKQKTLRKKLKDLRSKIGLVFQYPEYQLFASTVVEDVAFGVKNFFPEKNDVEVESMVKWAIEEVGLNYEEVKDKAPFELSGGQKRRVAIAGVIVTKPEVLVLDEPVAGLDPQGKKDLMKLLKDLHQSCCKTIIIVSHDMNEVAENCTNLAVFDEGKLIYYGSPKEVFKNAQRLIDLRLDVPDTAYIADRLSEVGVNLDTDFTYEDFKQKLVDYYMEKKGK